MTVRPSRASGTRIGASAAKRVMLRVGLVGRAGIVMGLRTVSRFKLGWQATYGMIGAVVVAAVAVATSRGGMLSVTGRAVEGLDFLTDY